MKDAKQKYEMKLDSQSRKHPTPARPVRNVFEIDPVQIVGDDSVESRIAEQVNQAARVRESMAHLSRCKTHLQMAVTHTTIPGKEVGTRDHVIPEFKRSH